MSTPLRAGLVDYGAGNFASVRNALVHLGAEVVPVRTAADVDRCSHLMLPGVGAFGACMRRLGEAGLVDALRARLAQTERPFLGLCVGMQLLASVGHEFGPHEGLGAIEGQVRRVEADGLHLPHMGWNTVTPSASGTPLLSGLGDEPTFYFVHSYTFVPADPAVVAATCTYGEPLTAVVARDRVFGAQFHPEKSQRAGLGLLRNFLELEAC